MAKKREERAPDLEGGALTHNPFKALAGGAPRAEPEPGASAAPADPSGSSDRGDPGDPGILGGKLVVRHESRGRAGKTVTRISGVAGDDARRDELLRDLKRALGVGATLEDGDLVLQGRLVERAARWLEEHGARQVVRGNG